MLLLAYTSKAAYEFTDGDVITLLISSRANNRRLGLTGILLYSEGRFVQVLEGPEDVVTSRYEAISADPRHTHVTLVLRQESDARQFPKWTMGYKSLGDPIVAMIPGYDTFFADYGQRAEGAVRTLLDRFRTDPSLRASTESD